MAGNFGVVDTPIWKHYVFKSLSDDAKLLFLYLKTCGHGNMIGCFHLPIMYICADLKWSEKKVNQTLGKLFDNGFVMVDFDIEYVLLQKHLDKHPLQNDNQVIGAKNLIAEIPSHFKYLNDLIEIFNRQERVVKPLPNSFKTVTNSESESASETETISKPKNRKKKFIPPTKEEVIQYFHENGYNKQLAIKAFNYYHEGNWKDSSGKQVRNWKQKMIANWFKEDGKIGKSEKEENYIEINARRLGIKAKPGETYGQFEQRVRDAVDERANLQS